MPFLKLQSQQFREKKPNFDRKQKLLRLKLKIGRNIC